MKKGFDYLGSTEQTKFNGVMRFVLAPLVVATERVVEGYLRDSQRSDLVPIIDQPRVGIGASVFSIHKFTTLDPETKKPLNPTAAKLRRYGLDELAQVRNLGEGNMNFVSWRPTLPRHYEEFRDLLHPTTRSRHDRLVNICKPGMLSSFGLYLHQTQGLEMGSDDNVMNNPEGAEIRAEMNLKDATDASLLNDLLLIKSLASFAVLSQLPGHKASIVI